MKERVVVFGGSGFLGSHVADELAKRDYQVIIYDLREYPRLKKNQVMVTGDINDSDRVREVIKGADIIYNFSAVADIEEAAVNPVETVKVNILGNTKIMNAAKDCKIKKFNSIISFIFLNVFIERCIVIFSSNSNM